MECPVCYESNFHNGELLWLQCLHPLCTQCLRKLVHRQCPLCRTDIEESIGRIEPSKPRVYSSFQEPILRVRTRHRRRQRRVFTDTLQLDQSDTTILIETYEVVGTFKKRGKNPNKNERFKRGKWANSRRQTYGSRFSRVR